MSQPQAASPPASTAAGYDVIARGYTAENDTSLLNEFYNRPAIRDLLGEVAGRRVLDAGCGSGPILADLIAAGADAVGFDGSPAMVAIARERLGPRVDIRVADLAAPLPYADDSFDDVVCSLALHYLQDWSGPLAEFRRVLRPGGRLIVSVEHPFVNWFVAQQSGTTTNYFATRQRIEQWDLGGPVADLVFWDRSLSTMVQSFLDAGFRITSLTEPGPAPEAAEKFPDFFAERDDPRFLAFLYIVVEA